MMLYKCSVSAVLRTRLLLAADSTSFIYLDWVCPPELGHIDLSLTAKELDVHHVAVVGPRAILQGAVLLAPKVSGVDRSHPKEWHNYELRENHIPEVSLVADGLEVRVRYEEDLAVGVDYRVGVLPPHLPRLARAMRVMSDRGE